MDVNPFEARKKHGPSLPKSLTRFHYSTPKILDLAWENGEA
jgi:hypothetical protein